LRRMMSITATKTRPDLLSFIAAIFLMPTLCAANASAHPATPIKQGFDNMYDLDLSGMQNGYGSKIAAQWRQSSIISLSCISCAALATQAQPFSAS
jgi:hypothetical protein